MDDVLRAIDDLLSHPDKLRQMHAASKAAGRPNAATDVVEMALQERLTSRAAAPRLGA